MAGMPAGVALQEREEIKYLQREDTIYDRKVQQSTSVTCAITGTSFGAMVSCRFVSSGSLPGGESVHRSDHNGTPVKMLESSSCEELVAEFVLCEEISDISEDHISMRIA